MESDDAPKISPERLKSAGRSLRRGGWRRLTFGEVEARARGLIGAGRQELRVFQIVADDKRHVFIEIFDPSGNAIDSEIGAEDSARSGAERGAFRPLPECLVLAQVGERPLSKARAQIVEAIQIAFLQHTESLQAV